MAKKTTDTNHKLWTSPVKLIFRLFILIFLILGMLFLYISQFLLPDTEELENPKYEIATEFISSDNQVFGKVFKYNREWLDYEDINPVIIQALISTEDERFFSHSGIDFRGTARAVFFLGRRGGASTITQQLAKQFFTIRARSFIPRVWQKLKEWVIAIEFEKRYTKEELLAMYLNKTDFLYDAVGVGAAAKTYFGKDQKNLETEEAAVLIAMLKNPRLYNPVLFPQNCFNRRAVVLKQMVKNGYLSEEEYLNKRLKNLNTENFKREKHYSGLAPHFRSELTKWLKNLLEEPAYRKPDGSKYNIYTDGLKIYTTIDTRIQAYAEEAMLEHMSSLQDRYNRVWQGKDVLSYQADARQKKIRESQVIQMMKNSDRYKAIRSKFMSAVMNDISENLDISNLTDTDIFRMFEEDKNPGHLKKISKNEDVSDASVDRCEKVLDSPYWPELKKQWNQMQKSVQKSFHTKVKMKVFAYNAQGEKEVEMTPYDSIKYHLQHMQIGSIAVDPKDGHILAWIGGINHKYFQYDHVNSRRQVGSTFKPFVYATAIVKNAMSPCQKVEDKQNCIQANDPNFKLAQTWCPSNADNSFSGETMTLKQALKESKNSVSVHLMKEIGSVEAVKNLVAQLGIDKDKIPNYPSICLGTPELSAMDMAYAYTAFANNGLVTKPIFVTRIEDKNGRVIYTAVPEQKRAIHEAYNYAVVDMLKYVVSGIQPQFKSQIAGKTGTTNDYKDGWFVGFTPDIVISTWVGGDQEFIRFNRLSDGQGAVMARPFFSQFLKKLERDNRFNYGQNSVFMRPEEELIEIDCSKYEDLVPNETQTPVQGFDEEF